MDKKQVTEYRARYEAVAAIEADELRNMSAEERWRLFIAIQDMAHELGLPARSDDKDEEAVWERWAQLKAGMP
jgi:hypothetical protein